ncbi:MAG: EAL domain-containing protein [Chloroflexota bacterium]
MSIGTRWADLLRQCDSEAFACGARGGAIGAAFGLLLGGAYLLGVIGGEQAIGALTVLAVAGSVVLGVCRGRGAAARVSQEAVSAELEELRRGEQRFRSMVLNTSDVVLVLRDDGSVDYQSPSAERIWGYTTDQLRGRNLFSLVHPDDRDTANSLFAQALQSPRLSMAAEFRLRLSDESWCHFEAIVTNLLKDPRVHGIIATFRDITERKEFEQMLQYQAFHDALTELPNRVLFVDRLERALVRASRHDRQIAVMFVDLDNFKLINDSLGHPVGDRLLTAVAQRMLTCVRQEDTLARLGGDEFGILVEEVEDESTARILAERLLANLEAPFLIGGHDVFVRASIGVTMGGPGPERPDDILRDADVAMYRAKANGKSRFEVFDVSMTARASERLELETSLRKALERNEFRVYYQPIIDIQAQRIEGFEALVRWKHPERGLISPLEFIPLAEETGLIVPIGEWILGEACRQMTDWQSRFSGYGDLSLSVNLSGTQLQHPGLVASVARVLQDTRFFPSRLKLEITESVMMRDVEATIGRLSELRELGVDLAVDDFGTGYSSLAYLRRFPVRILKIDRSFVGRLGSDPQDRAIIRSIISLANDLRLAVVGEGIETEEQLGELRDLGCRFGQGYLFNPPLPTHAVETLLVTGLAAGRGNVLAIGA